MDIERVAANIDWDFKLGDEFKTKHYLFTFIVDLSNQKANLALYKVGPYSAKSEFMEMQPPQEMLLNALAEQGVNINQEGLYPVNRELRTWIEKNILINNK